MIDIHCHILPALDDGAKDLGQSIQMARQALSRGITGIVATPHVIPGSDIIGPERIARGVDELNAELTRKGIDIVVHKGAEVFLDPSIPALLDDGKILAIAGKYILLELPFEGYPQWISQVLFEINLRGFKAIIAHPERNASVGRDPNLVYQLIEKGALIQMNSGSILGHFGREAKKTSKILISHNLVHFVGSDAHNTRGRDINLDKLDVPGDYTMDNPSRLVRGEDVYILPPLLYKEKKGLAWFFSKLGV